MLAQAGIDPHGYNLVLQGQIQSIVKMHPDERRKIIEEVAGISIYELRKEKSVKELEKTDIRLKEITTILRERTSYLRNLEKEKSQAEKYNQLKEIVRRCRASILSRRISAKEAELKSIERSIETDLTKKDKIKVRAESLRSEITELEEKIQHINKQVQQASGVEQETLHNEIANLKAEIEGLKVRKESQEGRRDDIELRIEEMDKQIPDLQTEIDDLRKKSPMMAKKASELKRKKDELALIESDRKKALGAKSELSSLRDRIRDRENRLARISGDSDSLLKQMEGLSVDFDYKDSDEASSVVKKVIEDLIKNRESLEKVDQEKLENEKIIGISESEIERSEKTRKDVEKIDTCPLCKSKMTQEHVSHVFKESDSRIEKARSAIDRAELALKKVESDKEDLLHKIKDLESKKGRVELETLNQRSVREKRDLLKKLVEEKGLLKSEVKDLEDRAKKLEERAEDTSKIEDQYERKIHEIEEISSRTEEDLDTTLLYKERDLESSRNVIKRSREDLADLTDTISDLTGDLKDKEKGLEDKEEQERKLNQKFKQMFSDRDQTQKEINESNIKLNEVQNEVRQVDDQINYLKIGKAKIDASHEALEMEMSEFVGVELLSGSVESLEIRLTKSQTVLQGIGNINMRALEVYEEVKEEYDLVYNKVETLEKEKDDIMKIIEEIDKKKKREFMKTFKAINDLFTRNFSKLSSKGQAYLEVENKEDIFAGGVNIVVRLAKGKYFDVTSLSGGEQTLVALSLLFAIQEHKPYHFYVFDEIDAALDKRNSERLAGLLEQYMKSGQYIVVTHNDAIIMHSNVLYGVSMHEGISKILSLKV